MERDNFNPYNFESSPEKPDDKKDEKKKKSATGLARLIAHEEAVRDIAKEPEKQPEKDDRSLLQKLSGETKAEPEPEKSDDKKEMTEFDQETKADDLSNEEEVAIAETYLEERTNQLAGEQPSPELTPEQAAEVAAETTADQAFLEAVQERLSNDDGETANVDEAIEAAFADVTGGLASEETPEETEERPEESDSLSEPDEEPFGPREFDPDQPIPLNTGGTGRGGGSGRPPTPPTSPVPPTPGRPGGPQPGSPVPRPLGGTPNAAPKRYDDAEVRRFERTAMGRGLLVGGVIGYLMGRRRGRISTEKRFKTVQAKLEKQVESIQQKIEQKEVIIRKMAREQVMAASLAKPEVKTTPAPAMKPEAPRAAPERKIAGTQLREQEPTAARNPEIAKDAVDTLSKDELLAYSSQIKVGETSLRRVYEAKLVDEKGLRRLIREYQAGHDLRRALAREFMVKELKFERDPSLRDLLPPEAQPRKQGGDKGEGGDYGSGSAAGAQGAGASQLAPRGSAKGGGDAMPAAGSSSRRTKTSQKNVSPLLLIGLTLVTIGLALYAIWLTVSK